MTQRRMPRAGRPPEEKEAAAIAAIVRLALIEDIGPGDATTLAVVDEEAEAEAWIVAKEAGILSGMAAAAEVARVVRNEVAFEVRMEDGDRLSPGDRIAGLFGPARPILAMERTLLNFLQRLSGVATITARYVEAIAGTGIAVADTRKTTPGMRFMEKAAVRHGGGVNHRIGLYDAMMIKDNHITAAGGIAEAVSRVRLSGSRLHLTVEARTAEEAAEAAGLEADQVLLDNMTPEEILRSVEAIRSVESSRGLPACTIEVSGGITLGTIREKAVPGVDIISVGALTHSAPALDISMDLHPGSDI